jgi:hypothetical protein
MHHLPGFWDGVNWADDKWAEFQRRQARDSRIKRWFDQWAHRWMARIFPREWWEDREAKQWPSGTGSYDACLDHWHWLRGRGLKDEADWLLYYANLRRPEFRP